MRAAAELGAWQLVSPADAVGRLAVVPDLHSVQDKVRTAASVFATWRSGSACFALAASAAVPCTPHHPASARIAA